MSVLRLLFLLGFCLATTVVARNAPKATDAKHTTLEKRLEKSDREELEHNSTEEDDDDSETRWWNPFAGWVEPVEEKPVETELEILQRRLNETELEELEPEFEDEEDEEEETDTDDDQTRFWNPFAWLMNLFWNKCQCDKLVCDCCFKLSFFSKQACYNAEVLDDMQIRTTLKVGDQVLVDRTYEVETEGETCGVFPVLPLNLFSVDFCFNQQSEVADDCTVNYCSTVDFKVGNSIGAVIQLKCLELKEGLLTFEGEREVDKDGMLSWQAKKPFTAAFDKIKKQARW